MSSGAAYAKVPATMCMDAWSTSDRILARPTSPILATPSCDSRMLDVFRSLRRRACQFRLAFVHSMPHTSSRSGSC